MSCLVTSYLHLLIETPIINATQLRFLKRLVMTSFWLKCHILNSVELFDLLLAVLFLSQAEGVIFRLQVAGEKEIILMNINK